MNHDAIYVSSVGQVSAHLQKMIATIIGTQTQDSRVIIAAK
jgi:hypothetical protein